jgi:hypothetical protein
MIIGGDPRLNQMALSILSLVDDARDRELIASNLAGHSAARQQARRETIEAQVLTALVEAFEETSNRVVRVSDVVERFNRAAMERFDSPLSNRALGHVIREKLGIPTGKHHGTYGIEQRERDRVRDLADRLGISHRLPTRAQSLTDQSAETADSAASKEGG